ncbi:MAG: hypothetical protein ACYDC3_10335 [Candidatus Binataceae bacterium]
MKNRKEGSIVEIPFEVKSKPGDDRQRASATWYTDFRRLQSDPHGVLLIRLMQAANDVYLANWTGVKYEPRNKNRIPPLERHMQIGANQYFIRLMSGHLNEGVSLIHEFNERPVLMRFLARLPSNCRKAYEELCSCLKDGPDFNYFRRTVGRLRDKAAFHYDPGMTRVALDHLANRRQPIPAKITMGGDFYLTRFNLADVVMDVALIRQILGTEADKDAEEGLAPFAEFLNRKCSAFVLFVKGFIATYLKP